MRGPIVCEVTCRSLPAKWPPAETLALCVKNLFMENRNLLMLWAMYLYIIPSLLKNK